MEKRVISILFITFTFYFSLFAQDLEYNPFEKKSVKQLREDFRYLKEQLIRHHPGLDWYAPATNFAKKMDSLFLAIDTPLNDLEFFKLMSKAVALTNERHTGIGVFAEKSPLIQFYSNKAKVLPISLKIIGKKAYLNHIISNDLHIEKGAEIISINGQKIYDIIEKLLPFIVSDGDIQTSKFEDLERRFRYYYYMFIEQPTSFEIRYKAPNNATVKTRNILAVTNQRIFQYHRKQHHYNHVPELLNVSYPQDFETSTAILTIHTTDDRYLKKRTGINLYKFLQKSFKKFHENQTENLIIDLRQNQGGNAYFEGFLYALIAPNDEKISIYKQSTNKRKGKNYVKSPKPKKYKFGGDIYILTSGQTYSAASLFCSLAKTNTTSVFVGQETGGNFYGTTAGSYKSITLPNTMLKVNIPTIKFEMKVEDGKLGRGVIPNYTVKETWSDFMEGKDVELEFVKNMINKLVKQY